MQDLQALFELQQTHFPSVARSNAAERAEKLRALLAEVLKQRRAICDAGNAELGSCDLDIDMQLMMIKTEIEFLSKNLAKFMRPRRVKNSQATMFKKCYIRYEPKGQVLNLSAWNAALAISLIPAIGALAAGNTVVIKPSELAPHSATVVADLIKAVYAPEECAVVEGDAEVAKQLLELPFHHIYYTGGQNVGRIVMRAAAENFAGITLEMGGKNPAFVDESADVENTARKLSWGRLANAGQACIAPDYVVAHESVVAPLLEAIPKYMEQMYNSEGRGMQQSRELARIINDTHFQRIKNLLDDAIAKGATVVYGGETDASDRFIAPTILTDVTDDMRIMQEEVFGPILTVLAADSRETMLSLGKRQQKPLALYIYARDRDAIDYFMNNTTAGSTVVNHNLIQSGTNPRLPFGGANHSGIGRIGGEQSFLEFSNARSVVEQPLGWRDININFPPYSDTFKKLVAKAIKP